MATEMVESRKGAVTQFFSLKHCSWIACSLLSIAQHWDIVLRHVLYNFIVSKIGAETLMPFLPCYGEKYNFILKYFQSHLTCVLVVFILVLVNAMT